MTNHTCSAGDCGMPVHVKKRGLCRSHYNRLMYSGAPELAPVATSCLHCGAANTRAKTTGPAPKYCSDQCKGRAAYERRIESGSYEADKAKRRANFIPKPVAYRPCVTCGSDFGAKKDDARFCSTRCSTRFRRTNHDGSCATLECSRTSEARGLCIVCWKREGRASGRIPNDPWTDRRKANYHKRRAQKVATQVEDLVPLDIYERDIWLCGLCSTAVDPDAAWPHPMSPSLDHIIPLSKGGSHTYENVQLAHLTCNVSKGNRIAA